jgi:hypothetical protein
MAHIRKSSTSVRRHLRPLLQTCTKIIPKKPKLEVLQSGFRMYFGEFKLIFGLVV